MTRENKYQIDWNNTNIEQPNFIGIKEICNYTISDLRPYIDWTFFFVAWEMKKLYPDILVDNTYDDIVMINTFSYRSVGNLSSARSKAQSYSSGGGGFSSGGGGGGSFGGGGSMGSR